MPRTFTYNPALDGLRAVAIAAVIAEHTGVPGVVGHHGVTLFFVVSGYLITSLLVAERNRTGTISLRAFYQRRFARLGPAMIVAVLAISAWLVASRQPVGTWWLGPVGALTSTVDLIEAAAGNGQVGIFQPMWSLGIEEQFYLIWPVALLLLMRRRTLAPAAAFLFLGIAVDWWARFVQNNHHPSGELALFGPVSHADSLLVGALLALLLHRFGENRRVVDLGRVLGPIGVVGFFWMLRHGGGFTAVQRYDAEGFGQVAILSAFIVWWLAVSRTSILARWLSLGPVVLVGQLSYGIYLWNVLLLRMFQHYSGGVKPWGSIWFTLWCAVLFGICYLSWRFIEKPLRRRWAPRRAAVVPGQEPAQAQQPVHDPAEALARS